MALGTEITSPVSGASSAKKAAYLVACALAAGAVLIAWTRIGFTQPPFGLDTTAVRSALEVFTAAQQQAAASYQSQIVWPVTLSLIASTAMAVLLGFTSLGERVVDACGRVLRRRTLTAFGVVVALLLFGSAAALPFDVWAFLVRSHAGLVVATPSSWFLDRCISLAITLAIGLLAVAIALACVRFAGRRWWLPAAAIAGLAVIAGAWLAPVVIEPLFANTTPISETKYADQLDGITRLARADDFEVSQVLVSDSSAKTTMLNAYVSGFNGRIVLYDTLLQEADPATVRMVVAHELSHASRADVLSGALVGAFAVAAFVALLGAWFERVDARALPRIFAVVAIAMVLAMPATNYLSRTIEWHADEHALALTDDPRTFISMQRQLAIANKSSLEPAAWRYWWFFTHPTSLQRIALGQAWMQRRP